jgi:hypothetical protein
MAICILTEKACHMASTLLALMRCIRWWHSGREILRGLGDMQQRVAEKSLFSALFGRLTKKTLLRV